MNSSITSTSNQLFRDGKWIQPKNFTNEQNTDIRIKEYWHSDIISHDINCKKLTIDLVNNSDTNGDINSKDNVCLIIHTENKSLSKRNGIIKSRRVTLSGSGAFQCTGIVANEVIIEEGIILKNTPITCKRLLITMNKSTNLYEILSNTNTTTVTMTLSRPYLPLGQTQHTTCPPIIINKIDNLIITNQLPTKDSQYDLIIQNCKNVSLRTVFTSSVDINNCKTVTILNSNIQQYNRLNVEELTINNSPINELGELVCKKITIEKSYICGEALEMISKYTDELYYNPFDFEDNLISV